MINNIFRGRFGIEKEALRVNQFGQIVNTKHPIGVHDNDKFKNPHITVDFSEQQTEVITGIHTSVEAACEEIKLLTDILYRSMDSNEYLWNYSLPLGNTVNAQIAQGTSDDVQYRKKLLQKTTFEMQLISGVHFNFSFDPLVIKKMSLKQVNDLYFNMAKRYDQLAFIVTKIFGMSPTKDFKTIDAISHRQSSKDGYNNHDKNLKNISDFTSYDHYRKYMNQMVKQKQIISWRESYGFVRTKPFNAQQISWIEVRNIDLDYRKNYGIDLDQLHFIHKFLVYLGTEFDENLLKIIKNINQSWTKNIKKQIAILILKDMQQWLAKHNLDIKQIKSYIKIIKSTKKYHYPLPNLKSMITLQKKIVDQNQGIVLKRLAKMELSSQILVEKAYKSGCHVQILDQQKNLIKINNTILEMATLNPFDSRSGLEIIDSKIKTNHYLKNINLQSTEQNIYHSKEAAYQDFDKFADLQIVIKPVNTNFSIGLTVFEKSFTKKDFYEAIDFAFTHDQVILIEKFVSGQEYRFLVIDAQVIGILKRIPANIIGDGVSTIKELIMIKNQNKLRGEHYHLPLEKIKLGTVEHNFLKQQHLLPESIPTKNKQIFLRKNSNVSTGGDTYDVTDQVAQEYKTIAIKATKTLGLKICGLDIIIPDISTFGKYTILEMNWNPAIHIHTYPLVGINRKPAEAIIKMVEKYEKKI